jgi:hypothetical protein
MDWIERWFGFSPDDGDGTVEWLIVLACSWSALSSSPGY